MANINAVQDFIIEHEFNACPKAPRPQPLKAFDQSISDEQSFSLGSAVSNCSTSPQMIIRSPNPCTKERKKIPLMSFLGKLRPRVSSF